MKYELGGWAETSYGPAGKIIAYTDQPTYTLERPDGTRSNVVESTISSVTEEFKLPPLPDERDAIVKIETRGGRAWLAWRSSDDWDVLDPRGTAHFADEPYSFVREQSGADITRVTFMKPGDDFVPASAHAANGGAR